MTMVHVQPPPKVEKLREANKNDNKERKYDKDNNDDSNMNDDLYRISLSLALIWSVLCILKQQQQKAALHQEMEVELRLEKEIRI